MPVTRSPWCTYVRPGATISKRQISHTHMTPQLCPGDFAARSQNAAYRLANSRVANVLSESLLLWMFIAPARQGLSYAASSFTVVSHHTLLDTLVSK